MEVIGPTSGEAEHDGMGRISKGGGEKSTKPGEFTQL